MKRTLLDEGVPVGLRDLLGRDDVRHVRAIGWAGLPDSDIIERAARERFEVFVTTDRKLRYQQNLGAKKLAFVILHTTDWSKIGKRFPEILAAIRDAKPGSFQDCLVDPRRGRRR